MTDPSLPGHPAGADPLSEALAIWDGVPAAVLARGWGVETVSAHRRVGSTNDHAWALAELGAPRPAVVVADVQDAGRGRRGRGWASEEGGLWMSVLLAAESPVPVLPLRVGLGVIAALRLVTPGLERGDDLWLKWPNDVWLGRRKLAGILCEARRGHVVIGIGVNVSQPGFGGGLSEIAISVQMASGLCVRRSTVAAAVLEHLDEWPGADVLNRAELARLGKLDPLGGRRVECETGVRGTGRGVLPDGAYRVETESGEMVEVRAGSIELEAESS